MARKGRNAHKGDDGKFAESPPLSELHRTKISKLEAENERLSTIIRQARTALEELRRGDALKLLKSAFPNEHAAQTGAPPSGGMSA